MESSPKTLSTKPPMVAKIPMSVYVWGILLKVHFGCTHFLIIVQGGLVQKASLNSHWVANSSFLVASLTRLSELATCLANNQLVALSAPLSRPSLRIHQNFTTDLHFLYFEARI